MEACDGQSHFRSTGQDDWPVGESNDLNKSFLFLNLYAVYLFSERRLLFWDKNLSQIDKARVDETITYITASCLICPLGWILMVDN